MKHISYYNMLLDSMARYNNSVVVTDENGEYRYSDILSGIDAFVAYMTERGIRKGDHVGLWAYNSLHFLIAYFAIVKMGAVAVLLNTSLPANEVRQLMENTDSEWLVYGNTRTLEKDTGCVRAIISDESHCINLNEFEFMRETQFTIQEITEAESKALSYMIFTSGSSGVPKAVMNTQYASLCVGDDFVQEFPGIHGTAICLAVPMFHCLGLHITVAHLIAGGILCLTEKFDTESLLKLMEKHPVQNMLAIITVYLRLLEADGFNKFAPQMKLMLTGGGAVNAAQISRIKYICPNAMLLNGYGQTEATGGISFVLQDDSFEKQIKTVGRPNPSKTVSIMDVRNGQMLPNNSIGEIVIKDEDNLMLGYYKLAQSSIDENGWLHTGDLGFIDDEGYIHLSGRIKDIIIKGGENITPSEIERELCQMEGISEVKVMGAPDSMYGESVQACVAVQSGYSLDSASIQRFMKGRVSSFKMPSNFFIFDKFPIQSNGKVNFVQLKVEMLQRLGLINAAAELENGIPVLSFTAISRQYVVVPIRDAVASIAQSVGFSKKKTYKISLCVEEILLDWLSLNSEKPVQLLVELRLQQDCLQLCVSDMGAPFKKDANEDTTAGRKIILSFVDRFSMTVWQNHTAMSFDFLYEDGMKVDNFVYHSNNDKQD